MGSELGRQQSWKQLMLHTFLTHQNAAQDTGQGILLPWGAVSMDQEHQPTASYGEMEVSWF